MKLLKRASHILKSLPLYWESAADAAEKAGKRGILWRVYFYLDMLFAYAFQGATRFDYMNYKFYWRNFLGRAEYTTEPNQDKLLSSIYGKKNFQYDFFNDKRRFNEKYARFIKRKWIYAPESSPEEIRAFVKGLGRAIAKPNTSAQGQGIFKISDSEADLSKLFEALKENPDFLIEEIVENHPDIARFNPTSLNTMRVVSVIDPEGAVHIQNVSLRIGSGGGSVDNLSGGGMACAVDVENGIISSTAINLLYKRFAFHPDTGVKLLGSDLPMMDALPGFVEEVAKLDPKIRFVGWDIAATPGGFELIEGNSTPGADVNQICDDIGKFRLMKRLLLGSR